MNILFKILEEEKPEYLTVTFDVHAPTFRHEMFADYKGTRKPMAEELRQQVPVIERGTGRRWDIAIIEKAGLEADDLLGTISRTCEEKGMEVAVISGGQRYSAACYGACKDPDSEDKGRTHGNRRYYASRCQRALMK